MNNLFKKIMRKGFDIELNDRNSYVSDKDFTMADTKTVKEAVEQYAQSNGHTVEFVSEGKPVVFVLDGKEKYTAAVELGHSRYNSGYYIHCLEVIE
ncbi:MAG: DUF4318 domain-containing protein [Oscillospiraceae bacterium]|nr:DUF4318 domain-containing protein [Oscillospiraceae bacterium]